MSRVLLALIHGFEEVEALTAVDILRRGGVDVITTSLGDSPLVTGRHEVPVLADALFEGDFPTDFDMIVIPGGTIAYVDHPGFMSYVRQFAAKKKPIAAICAAPAVLGRLGLLKGKTCVCYPGMEHEMVGANISGNDVETDGLITTGRGPGLAVPFALRVLEILEGAPIKARVAKEFLVNA